MYRWFGMTNIYITRSDTILCAVMVEILKQIHINNGPLGKLFFLGR